MKMNQMDRFDCANSTIMHSSMHSARNWDIPLQPQHAQLTYTKKNTLNGGNEKIKEKTWRWIRWIGLIVPIQQSFIHLFINQQSETSRCNHSMHNRHTQKKRVKWVKWKNRKKNMKMNSMDRFDSVISTIMQLSVHSSKKLRLYRSPQTYTMHNHFHVMKRLKKELHSVWCSEDMQRQFHWWTRRWMRNCSEQMVNMDVFRKQSTKT